MKRIVLLLSIIFCFSVRAMDCQEMDFSEIEEHDVETIQDMEKQIDELNQSYFLLQENVIKQLKSQPDPNDVQRLFIEKDCDLAAKVSDVNHRLDNKTSYHNSVSDMVSEFIEL